MPLFKRCTKCGKLKPYWSFYRNHADCKECAKKAAKRYYWAKKSVYNAED
jgi:recombinational DNA repair protein (RecF pathway)